MAAISSIGPPYALLSLAVDEDEDEDEEERREGPCVLTKKLAPRSRRSNP